MDIRSYIDINNISVPQFAKMTCLGKSTIYSYLSGRRTPREESFKKILSATDGQVTPNDFIGGDT